MDLTSTLVDAIIKVISYIISAIVLAGKPVLVSIYNNFISQYLLKPGEAFPNIVSGNIGGGVTSLYYFVMFNIYDPVLTIIVIILGLTILLNSSLNLGRPLKNVLIKVLLVLILSNISFFLIQDIVFLGSALYVPLWNYGAPGHSFSNANNILRGLEIGGSAGSIVSALILGIFVFLMLYLLLFLSLRLAVIYTFPVLIPLFTLLLLIPQTRQLGGKIWTLFIDGLISPILISIPLILSTYVVNNSTLVLGFLALADIIPILLSLTSGSRLGGIFLGQAVSRGMNGAINAPKIATRNVGGVAGGVLGKMPVNGNESRGGVVPKIGSSRQFTSFSSTDGKQNSLFFRVK
jgi:hypothetical protein